MKTLCLIAYLYAPQFIGGGDKVDPAPPIPEPVTVALVGSGLAGLLLLRRKPKKAEE